MHTLVVTNDFPPSAGGIETFVSQLAGRFPPDQVTVLASTRAPFSPAPLARSDAALPYQVIRHPARTLLPTPAVAKFAARAARQAGAESAWFGVAAPLALMAPALRRQADLARVVAATHGHEVWWAAVPGLSQALRRIGDGVDAITYLNDYTGRRIARALSPAARRRMVRLTPGITPEPVPHNQMPDAAEAGSSPDRQSAGPVVLCVSRLVPRKGQDQLIRAWPAVTAVHPEARLVIAGTGPYQAKLSRMAAASPASGSIRLTGAVPQDQLADLY
ncbi:MAG: glycosyltransferase family 4 protein, partial [Bifidobacteriaceae bacterium]|nr:glycosyltransferase family 4 protein [Bifidobacteriaceae bacterium]